jgi:uracil-DNA glycosylase
MQSLTFLKPALSNLHPKWLAWLQRPDLWLLLQKIDHELSLRHQNGEIIFPPRPAILAALQHTSPEAVRVVILGQDPYHGDQQATGLAFAVPPQQKPPPSLRNIYKELNRDLKDIIGHENSALPNLADWAKQGVLLLNSSLTVAKNQAGSHQALGWQSLTDAIIEHVSLNARAAVFVLWGASAQKKAAGIALRHLVLSAAHPSPLSAYRGFFGSSPFSLSNAYLQQSGYAPINWLTPKEPCLI